MKFHIRASGKYLPGWKSILEQIGIPAAEWNAPPADTDCSVFVLGDGPEEGALETARRILSDGGAVLCSGEMFGVLSGKRAKRIPVKYLIEEPDSPFSGIGLVDIYTPCHLPPDANAVLTDTGAHAVFAGELMGGSIVALPFDAGMIFHDLRVAAKSFYAPRPRLPFETVSLVARGGVRRLVTSALEFLHHARGLPFLHRWFVPGDQRSIFTWRIDTDAAECGEIARLAEFVHRTSVRTTWFVDVGSQRECLPAFAAMTSDEVGVHCFDHVIRKSRAGCLADIRRAGEEFARAGLHPRSYAAPYGFWNPEVGSAIGTAGFEYSSEFSYDYDNFPSFPPAAGGEPGVLQMPIHPVSIGSLRRQGFSEQEMKTYFDAVIDSKISAGEPVSLYYHPRDRNEKVVEHLFEEVSRRHLASLTMIEYARWWVRRIAGIPVPELSGSMLKIPGDTERDMVLHLTRQDGREAFVPYEREILMDRIVWTDRPGPKRLPDDIRQARRFNPWIPIIRAEDFLFGKWRNAG